MKNPVEPPRGFGGAPRTGTSRKLEVRDFMTCEKFAGGEAEWSDWSFDFKTLVNSINPAMENWFKECEDPNELLLTPAKLEQLYKDVNGTMDPKDLEARSKELFGILCLLTTGEA